MWSSSRARLASSCSSTIHRMPGNPSFGRMRSIVSSQSLASRLPGALRSFRRSGPGYFVRRRPRARVPSTGSPAMRLTTTSMSSRPSRDMPPIPSSRRASRRVGRNSASAGTGTSPARRIRLRASASDRPLPSRPPTAAQRSTCASPDSGRPSRTSFGDLSPAQKAR